METELATLESEYSQLGRGTTGWRGLERGDELSSECKQDLPLAQIIPYMQNDQIISNQFYVLMFPRL